MMEPSPDLGRLNEILDEVESRANYSKEMPANYRDLLSVALDDLTIARVKLYRSLPNSSISLPSLTIFDPAIDGFFGAGQMHFIPRSLRSRAWLLSLHGDETGSRRDLDEAWEIAHADQCLSS